MLAAQSLLSRPQEAATKETLLPMVQRMGYLQIDTIQAVMRSQYLVLWSRLGSYEPEWLDAIHKNGALFEYYAHALCYLPIDDYPIYRGMMLYDDGTGNNWKHWGDQHLDVIERVREIVEKTGPISSADFDSPTFSTGWGDVKQEKMALNRLFATGDLMVSHRERFRRYFDLRERILPDWRDEDALDVDSAHKALLLKAVRALGIAREDWVAPYFFFPKTGVSEILFELWEKGFLDRVLINGWDQPAYIHPDNLALIEEALHGGLTPTHTTLLSPFDPLVSDRERTRQLFNFDYKMESFTPAKDRQFGYFCLPILHHGRLIGRLDPKAHRREKRMEIKNIYLEPGIELTQELADEMKTTLENFTYWHGMEELDVRATTPSELQKALL